MKRETFDKAIDILADIKALKNMKAEYNDGHWVAFYGASIKEQPISDGMLRADLEKFIDEEIAKLEEEFEKL